MGSQRRFDESTSPCTTKYDAEFEVSFTTDHPRCPKNISIVRKWCIVIVIATTSLCVACASSLFTGTITQLEDEFGSSRTVTTLGLSTFVLGLALGPMVLAPLSEFYGRRPIYVVSTFLFAIWIIPCAVASNITTIIVARFFGGFVGSAFLSVAGGTVGDMFTSGTLQKPMMLYTSTPFLGPELGPLIGNFINYNTNWRWTFWTLLIWAGLQWILIVLLVPETYAPVLLRREATELRKRSGDNRWHAPIEKMDRSVLQTLVQSCYRPFLLMIYEPMMTLLCLFCAVILGILYLFFGAFDIVFTQNHGFKSWQVGLTFLGIMVGMIIGILSAPAWGAIYHRLLQRQEQETGKIGGAEPEYRLPSAIVGAPLIVVGMLWFAWTQYSFIHWIVPIIGSTFFGCGVILVFSGIFTFLVDSYPMYAASALAANSFARSIFAAMFPLFGPAMYNNLGYQWATFLLAMLAALLAPCPYIFYRYGKQIRKRSRYAGKK